MLGIRGCIVFFGIVSEFLKSVAINVFIFLFGILLGVWLAIHSLKRDVRIDGNTNQIEIYEKMERLVSDMNEIKTDMTINLLHEEVDTNEKKLEQKMENKKDNQ